MAEERFFLTRAGYDALKRELEALKSRDQQQLADYASTLWTSDPSPEEAAFVEAKVTKERTDERIGYLTLVLEHAEFIDEDPDPLRVDPGERVTVWDLDAREERQFTLVGSAEAIAGLEGVPIDSPMGKALLGHRVGDVVEVEVPDGKARYVIRKIEHISAAGDESGSDSGALAR